MKNKLKYLTEMSLSKKIKTKWFLVANILLALLIAGLFNIDSIIKLFGGDFIEKTKIYIIDNTNYTYESLKEQLITIDKAYTGKEESSYEIILSDKTYDEEVESIKEKGILIEIESDPESVLKVKLVSESFIDAIDYQLITTAINNTKTSIAIATSNISEEELNRLYSTANIERIVLDEAQKSEDENMSIIMTTVFPVVILPFFMLTIFLVQMIGAEINDEKTTRGMEIIISNVSPKCHFFSKMLAGNIFVIFQGILLILYAGIGFGIRYLLTNGSITSGAGEEISKIVSSINLSGIGSSLLYIVPLTLVLMLITFVAYSLLAGILASMTTNAEDFNQLQTPIMLISLAGYYLAMMAGVFKGALFIRILSYVPLISAILSPSLLVLGQIGIIDVFISIILTLVLIYLLIKYGLRIYKIGILNYSSKDLWKKMFKAMKEK